MAKLNLIIRDGVTGKQIQDEFPVDVPIRDLLPDISNKLTIPQSGSRKLINKTQSFEYNDDDTLLSRDTNENDVCLLTYEPEFGV